VSGIATVLDATSVTALVDRGFRGMARDRAQWYVPIGDRRTKDRLSDAARDHNRLQAGLRALVEQSISHLIASRRVVGFALADHVRTELVADALANAVAARDPAAGVIFHADRGCQYTSGDDALLADELQVTLSSGRAGQCWDNALAESFFASLKGECLGQQPWPTRTAARRATVEYIAWFNGTRLHSALGYLTPDEFETTNRKEEPSKVA